MNRKVALTSGALGLVLIVAGVAIATHRPGSSTVVARPEPSTAVDVPLVRVADGVFTSRVRAQGRVGSPSGGEVKVAFVSSGIITRIAVHVGQIVHAGDQLAQLDASGLLIDASQARSEATAAAASFGGGSVPLQALAGAKARLTAARGRLRDLEAGTGTPQSDRQAALAAVRQSEAKLATDRSTIERAATLFAGGVVALKDVEAARAQLAFDRADADANRAKAASAGSNVGASLTQARADVAQAESDVSAARAQVTVLEAQAAAARARFDSAQRLTALSTLTAPASGVVIAILKHPGEAVDPAQPAVVVGPSSTGEITLTLSADDARRVHPGDSVVTHLIGRDGSGNGHVRSVVSSVDAATQTTTVVVTGMPPGAVAGDAAEALIDVGRRHGVVIPTSAIIEDPQTGKAIVFVRERAPGGAETFVSREISVASGDDRSTLVASGLRSGERIAAQGAFDLLAPGGGG